MDRTQKPDNFILLSSEKDVVRCGERVCRPWQPWTRSVHALLRHFLAEGLPVPAVIEDGENDTTAYIEGEMVHPYAWSDEGLAAVAKLAANLHAAARNFSAPDDALWQPWCLRELGTPSLCSHGDIAPWNIITRDGLPIGLIDWEFAGPIDPLYEFARICWLFVQLYDDDLREKLQLPSAKKRAEQLRLMADAYGLSAAERGAFVEKILAVAICETAHEAIDPGLTEESEGPLWGFAWRTRSMYWIWRNRALLESALR